MMGTLVVKGLTLEEYKKFKAHGISPGQKICINCTRETSKKGLKRIMTVAILLPLIFIMMSLWAGQ